MKSKPIISLFQTMKIRLLDFHYLGLLFSPLFYEFSAKSLPPKGLNVVYLSKITATMLTFYSRTADVIYCADVTFFLHRATSGGLSLTAAFFLRRFLSFYGFKCYLGSFPR